MAFLIDTKSFDYLKYSRSLIAENLNQYNWTPEEYQIKIINDMIFDEKKRIVSLFKDYLLLDETNDFLRR